MKCGHCKTWPTFTERYRDCVNPKCKHSDKIHVRIEVREELLAVIEIAKRAKPKKQFRTRKLTRPQTKKHS